MSQIEGIGKFSPAGIVLEFESKLFGIISNGVKENQIALADILDVTFQKGFMKKENQSVRVSNSMCESKQKIREISM